MLVGLMDVKNSHSRLFEARSNVILYLRRNASVQVIQLLVQSFEIK